MSWTKNEFWETIAQMGEDEGEEMYFGYGEPIDEKKIGFFPDRRIDHAGYQEFDCSLCGNPNTRDEVHKQCADDEQAWADQIDDDEPW